LVDFREPNPLRPRIELMVSVEARKIRPGYHKKYRETLVLHAGR
jgi:hypothetical protein